MRLPVAVTAVLIAIAIAALFVTDVRDSGDTLAGRGAPQQATPTNELLPSPTAVPLRQQPTSAPPLEAPTASPWLRPPEWVAGSPDILNDFYLATSILDIASGQVWHVTAPGRAPFGQQSPIAVNFLAWTPGNEAVIGVSGGGRTALHVGQPGGDLRYWTTVQGSDLWQTHISWSPDGVLLAIGESIIDAATGEIVTEILPGSRIGWSADSRFFAVATASEDSPSVIAWDRETGTFAEAPLATQGVWSGAGHRLAYAPERREPSQPRLNQVFAVDFAGGANGAVSVLSELRGYAATPVAWSSSGKYLVVAVLPQPASEFGPDEFHIVDLETQETTAIITSVWQPMWSPTDDTLLFIGNICAGFDIFTFHPSGARLTNHTASDSLDLWPRWSPDGASFVHVAYGEDRVTLTITSIAEGAAQTVLSLPSDALSPHSWSPDGSYIAFRYGGGRGLCEGAIDPQETTVRVPE